jgi:hypothetical protein
MAQVLIPIAIAFGPTVLLPRLRRGLFALFGKYKNVPAIAPMTSFEPLQGAFPERDAAGNSGVAHTVAGLLSGHAILNAAFHEPAGDLRTGLALLSTTFIVDSITHQYIAGGPGKAEGNIIQRGHALMGIPVQLVGSYALHLMGGTFGLIPPLLPVGSWWMLLPRVILNKYLLVPVSISNLMHGLGLFGIKKKKKPTET